MSDTTRSIEPPPSLDGGLIRARMKAAVERLVEASNEFGLQPGHPETVFVNAMIDVQSVVCENNLLLVEELDCIVRNNRHVMSADVVRSARNMEATRELIGQLRKLMEDAIASLKMERADTEKQMFNVVLPRVLASVNNGLVIREKRVNVQIFARTVFGVASLMVGLVLFGSLWGSWNSWRGASRLEDLRMASVRCKSPATSRWCRCQPMGPS